MGGAGVWFDFTSVQLNFSNKGGGEEEDLVDKNRVLSCSITNLNEWLKTVWFYERKAEQGKPLETQYRDDRHCPVWRGDNDSSAEAKEPTTTDCG